MIDITFIKAKGWGDEVIQEYLKNQEYLDRKGWPRSVINMEIVDREGNPIPWITYGAIDYLESVLKQDMTVFEFGSGNSTLWLSKKVRELHSCEHSFTWAEKMSNCVPKNVSVYWVDLVYGGNYCSMANHPKKIFDVIIIDGRDRVNCIKNSIGTLSSSGLMVLDNSEREEYKEGINFLESQGYKKIDFFGMGPRNPYSWCTSIFSKA